AELTVRVTCSGGTYVRALARDLGRLSGSAAHLRALRRTNSGPFSVESAVTVGQVRAGELPLASLRTAVPHLPAQRLDALECGRVVHGGSVDAKVTASPVALVDDEETLVAVAELRGLSLSPMLVLRDG
ncbi:MAG TPA: hypothetical protein VHV78_02975, partial [Gemmatimonadaceae bacterium]|nr:hypothetical protein [Gemmatimonadaceae bacterium]